MQDNLKDILSHLTTEVDQEALLQYLQGKLAPERQHELEMHLQDNEFDADALEGLQQFQSTHQVQSVVDQLNRDLKKKTRKKQALREKLRLKNDPWLLITVLILLLLIIISFIIIYLHEAQ
ncbi:hypothetical protein V9K67_04830 [Paraflavisolibacter sp. H34]|uniref:hypothetical protein n=1 Tax=Huijunlia imazamoxiresistens TaxID=3127457 RepID=UPI00301AE8E8